MRGIIFDFNGTMVFDGHYHDEAWRAFSTKLRGIMINDQEIEEHVHGNVNEKIIAYLLPHISGEENKRLSLKKEELYRELTAQDENYKLVDGLVDMLNQLKKDGIPCAIASASIKENIDYFVKTFQLDKWFDINHIIYDDGSYENKKQMFLDAAQAIGVPIDQCVICEDSLSGITCAKAVQPYKIVAVASGEKARNFASDTQIDLVIEDFTNERVKTLLK